MKRMVKRAVLLAASGCAVVARLVPYKLRRSLILGLVLIESRVGTPAESLKRLYAILDGLDLLINERAVTYGGGEHPKHHLTGYHDFFVRHIPTDSKVLDIGCGCGALARSIASRVTGVKLTGIDMNKQNIKQAELTNSLPNIIYLHGDATDDLPHDQWDAIVMSNVLEHLDNRVEFLKRVIANHQPTLFLIRVPLFDRHWNIPMREELGINYFSDPTHFIEYKLEEFAQEMHDANLKLDVCTTKWGEIWAVCKVTKQATEGRKFDRYAGRSSLGCEAE